MKPKKSPKANLENKRGLFFQIGIATALLLMIGVFATSQPEKKAGMIVTAPTSVVDPDLPPPTPEKPKVETAAQPFIPTTQNFNPVPNDWDIINPDINWDPDEIPFPEPAPIERIVPDDEPPVLRAEQMPTFLGGELDEFRRWVMSKISYPSVAVDNGIEGRVIISFVIEKDGSLTNIEVLSSPDRSLSDEAARVLKLSPQWEPGKQRNTAVRVRFNLPLEFKLKN